MQVAEKYMVRRKVKRDPGPIESLVGSAFDLLQYLAFPFSLIQLKCVAVLALKRHPPFTNTVRCLIFPDCVALERYRLGRLDSVFFASRVSFM